jgi:hypothetical protein
MPDPRRVMMEMGRVLRPGGLLLTTNRVGREGRLLPGKAFRKDALEALLHDAGFQGVNVAAWQVQYDQVWARNSGWAMGLVPDTLSARLRQALRCPSCQGGPLVAVETPQAGLKCSACGTRYPVEGNLALLEQPALWTRVGQAFPLSSGRRKEQDQ